MKEIFEQVKMDRRIAMDVPVGAGGVGDAANRGGLGCGAW